MKTIKTISKVLLYYAVIPFAASLPGLLITVTVSGYGSIFIVPFAAMAIIYLFRNKLDLRFAAKVNAALATILFVCFIAMMFAASGEADGVLMQNYSWFIIPFAPVTLTATLLGQHMLVYMTALLTYVAVAAVAAHFGGVEKKKLLVPAAIIALCIAASMLLYLNRPSRIYAGHGDIGHGFKYMNGYSSTDFSDYMVYSENCKLAVPDSEVTFTIENEEDMPSLDGAEACYPLYAAFAKAVYKDIDVIEKKQLSVDELEREGINGKVVEFSNTIFAFERLVDTAEPDNIDSSYPAVDMFFGARPSAGQMKYAEEAGVELEITPIGREAFVFFEKKNNPVNGLSCEQLRKIYHGDIVNWKELGGRDEEIMAFQRPEDSGSQTMMEYFMGDVPLKEPMKYEVVHAMEGVVEEVAQYANKDGAIGYSFRYFIEGLSQEKGVKLLSVDGVDPTLENIENGTYPLTVDVCLITRKNDPNPNVQRMKEFILSDAGQEIVRKTGYGGLPKQKSR